MAPDQSNKPNQVDREAKELVSVLTNRLAELHYMGKSVHKDHDHEEENDDDEKGAKIITLAGSNTGAIMQGELLEESNESTDNRQYGFSSRDGQEANKNTTYANSNFQAINNSIMFNSNYTCDDPGVHIETTEYFDQINAITASDHVDTIEKVKNKKISSKTKQGHSGSSSSSSSDEKGTVE